MINAGNNADLASMTKAQLLNYAADHDVGGVSSRNTKAQIISTIEASE